MRKPAATRAKPAPRGLERVAVVFIHGQGQQTPMTDVVELARSVWRTDPDAAQGAPLAPVYSVPVYHAEASARRIVSQPVRRPASAGGGDVQVDFYQFYWADLVMGNKFTQLWQWFVALIRKDPEENVIPGPLLPARRLTLGIVYGAVVWALTLGGSVILALLSALAWPSFWTAAAWAVGLGLAGVAVALWGWLRSGHREPANTASQPPPALAWIVQGLGRTFEKIPALLSLWMAVLGLALAARRAEVVPADAVAFVLAGLWLIAAVAALSRKRLSTAFGVALALIAASCLVGPFAEVLQPQPYLRELNFDVDAFRRYALGATLIPALVLGYIGWMLYESFLLPVMTESARLFTPSPCNIPNQNKIRERGLQLLEDLHRADANYDRIVVLAHSLGTAVGYGLLTYYWGRVNTTLDHAGTAAARRAVEQAAAALGDDQAAHTPRQFLDWRDKVRAYGAALRRPKTGARAGARGPSRWKISDFITIGSPLTYAAFLMEPTDAAFREEVVTYRHYATCPPRPSEPAPAPYGFTVAGTPHHAALFGATCWTNLYFPSRGLFWGDIIGGEIAGPLGTPAPPGLNTTHDAWPPIRLGRGVLDVPLTHDAGLPDFAHSEYWTCPGDLASGAPAPDRTMAMRTAFHFFQAPRAADATLMAWGQTHPQP